MAASAVPLACVKTLSQALDYAHFGIAAAQSYQGKGCPSGVKAFTLAENTILEWVAKGYSSSWYLNQAKTILHQANTVCRSDLGLSANAMPTTCGTSSTAVAAAAATEVPVAKAEPVAVTAGVSPLPTPSATVKAVSSQTGKNVVLLVAAVLGMYLIAKAA